MNTRQAVVLSILLTKGEIKYMAPAYVEEKVEKVLKYDDPWMLLDKESLAIYREWAERWTAHIIEQERSAEGSGKE